MWRTPARVGGPDERAVLLAPVLGLGGGHHEEGVDALERGDRGLLVGVLADPDVALDVGGAPGVADEQAQVEAEVGSGEGAGDQPAEGSGGPGDGNHVVGNLRGGVLHSGGGRGRPEHPDVPALRHVLGEPVRPVALPLVEPDRPGVALQDAQVRRLVAHRAPEEVVPDGRPPPGRPDVEHPQLEQAGELRVVGGPGPGEADERAVPLGDPHHVAPLEGAAPVVDALLDPHPALGQDLLRDQPGVGVVPAVQVQLAQRLGVGRARAADRDVGGEAHGSIVWNARPAITAAETSPVTRWPR